MPVECIIPQQEFPLAPGESQRRQNASATFHAAFEDLLHDLRQPLSCIDSITYFLELTVADPQVSAQVQKIRNLLGRASDILERATVPV
jgi:signal transduction histidine kinase